MDSDEVFLSLFFFTRENLNFAPFLNMEGKSAVEPRQLVQFKPSIEKKKKTTISVHGLCKTRTFLHELHIQAWITNCIDIRALHCISLQTMLRAQIMFVQVLANEAVEFQEDEFDLVWIVCLWLQYKCMDQAEDDRLYTNPQGKWVSCDDKVIQDGRQMTARPVIERRRRLTMAALLEFTEGAYTVSDILNTELQLFRAFDYDVYCGISSLFETAVNVPTTDVEQVVERIEYYVEQHLLPRQKSLRYDFTPDNPSIDDEWKWLRCLLQHLDPCFMRTEVSMTRKRKSSNDTIHEGGGGEKKVKTSSALTIGVTTVTATLLGTAAMTITAKMMDAPATSLAADTRCTWFASQQGC